MGESVAEATLTTWLKEVGDTIESGDTLAEVETDKATMELEAYDEGILLYTAVEAGNGVPVDGVIAIMDVIIIAALMKEQHDEILFTVIERATHYNLKVSFAKRHIRQPSVTYVGHLLISKGLKSDLHKMEAVRNMLPPWGKDSVRRFLGFCDIPSKIHFKPQ